MRKSIRSAAVCSLLLMGCSSAPPQVQSGADTVADIYVTPAATYEDSASISSDAKAECGLDKSVVNNFAKFSKDFKFSVVAREAALDSKDLVRIEIVKLVAGRAGNGFGGRYVVSEMAVTARLNDKITT